MKKALIIIDIQNDYFENGRYPLVGSLEASLKAKVILDDFRKNNLPVIHIQHINNREGAPFFLPNTDGVNIHSNVQALSNEKIIIKHYPNSFKETELLTYLQELGIQELVICGMMTHMCIDTTVRAAKDLGFVNLLIGDACATLDIQYKDKKVNAADVHTSFLGALHYSFATVITTDEYTSKEYLK